MNRRGGPLCPSRTLSCCCTLNIFLCIYTHPIGAGSQHSGARGRKMQWQRTTHQESDQFLGLFKACLYFNQDPSCQWAFAVAMFVATGLPTAPVVPSGHTCHSFLACPAGKFSFSGSTETNRRSCTAPVNVNSAYAGEVPNRLWPHGSGVCPVPNSAVPKELC